jgi:hypothetical protein
MKLFHILAVAALLGAPSCASVHTTRAQMGGGNPPEDPAGVPIGGTAAAFQPHDPNFYAATSLGSPGTGAFAGSGPAKIQQHKEAMAGQRPPRRVPEVPAPRNSYSF